jgi:hypothetical protein
MRERNVYEICRQHDWRYRIQAMYEHFGLATPAQLRIELDQLRTVVDHLGEQLERTAPPA